MATGIESHLVTARETSFVKDQIFAQTATICLQTEDIKKMYIRPLAMQYLYYILLEKLIEMN